MDNGNNIFVHNTPILTDATVQCTYSTVLSTATRCRSAGGGDVVLLPHHDYCHAYYNYHRIEFNSLYQHSAVQYSISCLVFLVMLLCCFLNDTRKVVQYAFGKAA